MNKNLGNGDNNNIEDALRDAGKSEDEVKRTGALDRADEGVEELFGEKARTTASPVHRVIWDSVDDDAWLSEPAPANPEADAAIQRVAELMEQAVADGTIYDEHGKLDEKFLSETLGRAGYWGLRIDPKFGGKGASDRAFMQMITRLATIEATAAGLASIHGCIGAVDPTSAFGNDEQKARLLPKLASGESLSAFALTEPGAGSDMTNLKTVAIDKGEYFEVTGEKLFISNAIPGRTIGLVVMIDGKPSVLIAELPKVEDETFRVKHYNIKALRRTYNNGLVFTNFRVPKANLLEAPRGNGLIIAYHGLNYGRVALCANSAGVMRVFLRSITPQSWGAFRKTYGQAIEKRELVKRRIARLAALIVGADALTAWCSTILDNGYRGELECIIAKIFGSEAQKEAAIELVMKTHGGRSFLEGHIFGDNLYDFLAPCIYEGEGEMLGMALFKGLGKKHITDYMVPLGNSQKAILKGKGLGTKIGGVFGMGWNVARYGLWYTPRKAPRVIGSALSWAMAPLGLVTKPLGWVARKVGLIKTDVQSRLKRHRKFGKFMAQQVALELTEALQKHQLKLVDRQCRIALLSQRAQDAITMLIVSSYGMQSEDPATKLAADVLCQDLQRKLTGEAVPGDDYFKACNKLASMVIDGQFKQIANVPGHPVLQAYDQK
jgi:alkylation response protein AidB-like acyl-CoA dehydrogenase